jgi:hypothetical protein
VGAEGHGGERKKRETVVEKEKLGKKLIFLSTLAFNFSSLWP